MRLFHSVLYELLVTDKSSSQNIIVGILAGVLQDSSPTESPFEKVTPLYVVLSIFSLAVSIILMVIFLVSKHQKSSIYVDIARLQWTRKQRISNGNLINERKAKVGFGGEDEGLGEDVDRDTPERRRMKLISKVSFGVLILWVVGSWCAYFWGVSTGNSA
jgi:hypothetical protein